jgi:hypothetical protein
MSCAPDPADLPAGCTPHDPLGLRKYSKLSADFRRDCRPFIKTAGNTKYES